MESRRRQKQSDSPNTKYLGLSSFAQYATVGSIQNKKICVHAKLGQSIRVKKRSVAQARSKKTKVAKDGWCRDEHKTMSAVSAPVDTVYTDISFYHPDGWMAIMSTVCNSSGTKANEKYPRILPLFLYMDLRGPNERSGGAPKSPRASNPVVRAKLKETTWDSSCLSDGPWSRSPKRWKRRNIIIFNLNPSHVPRTYGGELTYAFNSRIHADERILRTVRRWFVNHRTPSSPCRANVSIAGKNGD